MIRRIVGGDKAVFQSTKNLKTLKWKKEGWGQVDDLESFALAGCNVRTFSSDLMS